MTTNLFHLLLSVAAPTCYRMPLECRRLVVRSEHQLARINAFRVASVPWDSAAILL
jgi:hypothetical protein